MPQKDFLTVSELNGLIREVIQMGFPRAVWVCGEIQGYDRNRNKRHVFFELCEKDPDSQQITARVSMVIFAGRQQEILSAIRASDKAFRLKDDIEVKFLCKVDFYPPHGAVRLIVEAIDPVFTLGKIAQERQRLITLLREKGVLDKNKALAMPLVPLGIGLITAHNSAAYNDFLSECKMSGLGFRIRSRNALMQGKGCEADVCRALDDLGRVRGLDVIVITRGGGSIADLSFFDSRLIAEKIAQARVPVLSGIGHEINLTVTDLAAHTHQKTPTAIAAFLVERVEAFLEMIHDRQAGLFQVARQGLAAQNLRLKQKAQVLQGRTEAFLRDHSRKVIRSSELIRRQPLNSLSARLAECRHRQEGLLKAGERFFRTCETRMAHDEKLVSLAHPGRILKRGFSITRTAGGKAVKSSRALMPGETIVTEFSDGRVQSKVEKDRAV